VSAEANLFDYAEPQPVFATLQR